MPRIAFYTLEPGSPGDRFLLTCQLADQAWGARRRVLIHCPEPEQARHLDRLLWTFRQDRFIPHGLLGQVDPDLTPILIGQAGDPPAPDWLLINLSLQAPDHLSRFDALWEPLDQDPAILAAGRERFRVYRDQGYTLEHQSVRLDDRAPGAW